MVKSDSSKVVLRSLIKWDALGAIAQLDARRIEGVNWGSWALCCGTSADSDVQDLKHAESLRMLRAEDMKAADMLGGWS
jgi:hypothetical protein